MDGRNLRQGGSLAAGGILLVLIAIWVVLYLVTDRSSGIEPVLWVVAFGLLVWAVLLRPSLRIGTDGVTMRNIVRDVHLPWPTIDLVEARWSLKLFTPEGEGHQSWAIAAQSPRRSAPMRRTGVFGGRADPPTGDGPASDPTLPAIKERGASAARVGAAIRDGVEEWPRHVERGTWPAQQERVTVSPAIPGIVALTLVVVLVVWALVI